MDDQTKWLDKIQQRNTLAKRRRQKLLKKAGRGQYSHRLLPVDDDDERFYENSQQVDEQIQKNEMFDPRNSLENERLQRIDREKQQERINSFLRIEPDGYEPTRRRISSNQNYHNRFHSKNHDYFYSPAAENAWWPSVEEEPRESKRDPKPRLHDGRRLTKDIHEEVNFDNNDFLNVENFQEIIRELREANEADDGGLEKKLEELPESFWSRISKKIKIKVPLICSAFRAHELAVEKVLTTYLNMVGLAAHKGLQKYCRIISAKSKVDRVSHDGNSESDENEPKPSLLMRFFNFINARLEHYFGISTDESTQDENVQDSDSKNLVFHANNLNLILFPPSMDKVHKVIDNKEEQEGQDLTAEELQQQFWDGTVYNENEIDEMSTHETPTTEMEMIVMRRDQKKKKLCSESSAGCLQRGVRHTPTDYDDYLDGDQSDYYREARRHSKHRATQRKQLHYNEDRDYGNYDLDRLNPKMLPEVPGDEPPEGRHPPEEKPLPDEPSMNFHQFEKKFSLPPQATSKPHAIGEMLVEDLSQPLITPNSELSMTLPVKLIIFIPTALLVLLLIVLLIYLVNKNKKRNENLDYDNDFSSAHFAKKDQHFGDRLDGLTVNLRVAEESSTEGEDGDNTPRGPSALQEKGIKKTREQSYKDDLNPVGPKKKRKFLGRSKKDKKSAG